MVVEAIREDEAVKKTAFSVLDNVRSCSNSQALCSGYCAAFLQLGADAQLQSRLSWDAGHERSLCFCTDSEA
jgi:hypothetical protein